MTLDVLPLDLHFIACDRIHFPPGKFGNILRGALGMQLYPAAPQLFAPHSPDGPSGLADAPRCFVFRAAHLDGRTVAPGESFHFHVNLFDLRQTTVDEFLAAFRSLAGAGVGPGRGRANFTGASVPAEPLHLPLSAEAEGVTRIAIDFLTPTELKPVNDPEFPILFGRVRDRISTLRALYGPGPLDVDFKALGESAAAVRRLRCDLEPVTRERRSARTGQTHPIGGFTGTAEYAGSLDPFLPYLRAAVHTGIGRHTVWGNGEIAVRTLG
jgi:hypothetical protein